MSVWLTIPSARPPAEVEPVLKQWRAMGYRIALWRDEEEVSPQISERCDLIIGSAQKYPGYAQSVNQLIKVVLMYSDGSGDKADWCVAAGDDTLPDPNKTADQIAAECNQYFDKWWGTSFEGYLVRDLPSDWTSDVYATFGVMQPTGDPWRDVQGKIIDRIAGSAWLGREWCKRINQGKGPLWTEYTHCFVDEELQCVAQKYGVFWQRPDLTHHHEHWARKSGNVRDMPAHLIEANSAAHWDKYKGIFTARKAAGFPGSEPL